MSPKSAKLSPAMQHVLDRMDEGWTLHLFGAGGFAPEGWLYFRRGMVDERHERVNVLTVRALTRRKRVVSRGDLFSPTFSLIRAASGGPGGDHD